MPSGKCRYEHLMESIEYKDGVLFTKIKIPFKPKGTPFNSKNSNGYIAFNYAGVSYLAHRVIWEFHYGSIPNGMQIDHIDGLVSNNRIENLRIVNRKENNQNQKMHSTNTVGITGVYKVRPGCYRATIGADRKHLYRGDDFFEACCARKGAEMELGYHKNHGTQRYWDKQ